MSEDYEGLRRNAAMLLERAETAERERERYKSDVEYAYNELQAFDNYGSDDLAVCVREVLRVVTADLPQAIAKAERERDEARGDVERLNRRIALLMSFSVPSFEARIAELEAALAHYEDETVYACKALERIGKIAAEWPVVPIAKIVCEALGKMKP